MAMLKQKLLIARQWANFSGKPYCLFDSGRGTRYSLGVYALARLPKLLNGSVFVVAYPDGRLMWSAEYLQHAEEVKGLSDGILG